MSDLHRMDCNLSFGIVMLLVSTAQRAHCYESSNLSFWRLLLLTDPDSLVWSQIDIVRLIAN